MNKRTRQLISLGVRQRLKDEGYYKDLNNIKNCLEIDLIVKFKEYKTKMACIKNGHYHPIRNFMLLRSVGL